MTTTTATLEHAFGWPHRRIDLDDWNDVYVVGDVHGCLDALDALLDRLELAEDDLVVFVGDLIRKGPQSRAVIERVRTSDRMLSVRGNNEQKLIDGDVSLPSFGPTAYRYVEELPIAISWDGGLVVHGGVDPCRPPSAHGPEELLTMRSTVDGSGYDGPFWFDRYEGPPRVFFGHTVLERPIDREWVVGLDTGCVYGGALTAYDVHAERVLSVRTDEHVPRPPEKIVSPEP